MKPPRKRVKSLAPEEASSEQKTHKTRKTKLKKSSLDYGSPSDEKEYRPSYQRAWPSKTPKKVIVPRPAKNKKNLRDPFNVLDDDTVFLIISHLSATETEILRRVSKLWKASSEAHCGRNALQKHFPLAAARIQGYGSREEENLRFRRHLYYHESLAIGNATRAIQCTGALDWQLKHDTLVWSNKKGDLSIQILRTRNEHLPVTSPATSLDFRSFEIPLISMDGVQLAEDGDLIVDLQNFKGDAYSPLWRHSQKLMKTTRQGAVIWEHYFKSSISTPAVGKDALFFVEHSFHGPALDPVVAFVKLSLEDGSTSYRNQLPERHFRAMPNESDNSLRLFCDEAYAVWRDKENYAYVFSTETGQVLQVYKRSTRAAPVVSCHSSSIWDINPKVLNSSVTTGTYSQLVTCQQGTPALKFEPLTFPYDARNPDSEWRFSGDHLALVYFAHVVLPSANLNWVFHGQNELTDPCTNVWVTILEKGSSDEFGRLHMRKKTSSVPISLPSRSETLGDRRPLELDLPWKLKEDVYLSMVDDYMVYHSPDEEILYLIDFWPNW